MSAPGVQLGSGPSLTYFQPTVREYLQSIREAVASDNLSTARQAFAQLTKAISVSAHATNGQPSELAVHVSQGVKALGKALEAGDFAAAQEAVAGIRTHVQSIEAQGPKPSSVTASETSGSTPHVPAEGGPSDGGSTLSVRA